MENLKFPCIISDVEVGIDMGKTVTVAVNRVVSTSAESLMLEISQTLNPLKNHIKTQPQVVDYYAELMKQNGWTRQQAKMAMFPFIYGSCRPIPKTLMVRDEPKSVFQIQRLWINYKNNTRSSCIGYESMGFVMSEEEAKEICSKGKTFTIEDCWALLRDTPQFVYEEIKHYDRRYEKG